MDAKEGLVHEQIEWFCGRIHPPSGDRRATSSARHPGEGSKAPWCRCWATARWRSATKRKNLTVPVRHLGRRKNGVTPKRPRSASMWPVTNFHSRGLRHPLIRTRTPARHRRCFRSAPPTGSRPGNRRGPGRAVHARIGCRGDGGAAGADAGAAAGPIAGQEGPVAGYLLCPTKRMSRRPK